MRSHGFGFNDDLYPAIGRVVVEAALLDELLSEVLDELVAGDHWVNTLWDGQSTDWLLNACKMIPDQRDSYQRRWTGEEHARLANLLSRVRPLSELRNTCVHGNWSEVAVDDDGTVRPRPFSDDASQQGDLLFCIRSRRDHKWFEQAFAVADIHRIADEFRILSEELSIAVFNMQRRYHKTSKYLLPRWVEDGPNSLGVTVPRDREHYIPILDLNPEQAEELRQFGRVTLTPEQMLQQDPTEQIDN
jgi:hypothetical protein